MKIPKLNVRSLDKHPVGLILENPARLGPTGYERLINASLQGRSARTRKAYIEDLRDFGAFLGHTQISEGVRFFFSDGHGFANSASLAYKDHLLSMGRSSATIKGTKTRSDSYWVPLWQEAQTVLKSMPRFGSDLIFTQDGNLLTDRQVQHAYDRAFVTANLPHRGTHVCRHTGSTMFLDQTQDLLALQQLGGWKNQVMPQHYAKIRSQRAELAMREAEKRIVAAKGHDDQEGLV